MPLHDYCCESGHKFERFVSLSALSLKQKCECGSDAVRLICAPYVSAGSNRDTPTDRNGTPLIPLMQGEEVKAAPPPEFCRKQRRDDIKSALKDIECGRLPPPPVHIDL